MKAIINGLRYDTDNAEKVHAWTNGLARGDLRFRTKTLYRTRGGRWFIHHEGGPMTDLAQRVGDGTITGGEKIEPVSEDDAFRFLVTHGGEEAAERYFADQVQDA